MAKKSSVLNKISKIYFWIGGIFLLVATLIILSPLYPYIWFRINNESLAKEQQNVESISKEITSTEPSTNNSIDEDIKLPPQDDSLSEINTLIISSIGVNGQIHENSNPDVGLKQGIWRASKWGNPIDNNFPIILASHRFGYLYWSRDFRRLNSFQDLPKTQVGDTVNVIWDQRLFNYEIYKAEENTEVTDYSADLILYTCKSMNSSVRVFRYANRTD
jgi:sortase (surface protein transpeptidase)